MTPLTKSLVECLSRARHYWEKLLGQIGTEFVPNLSKSVINFPWIVFRLYIHVPRSVRGARRLQTRPIVGVTFIHNPHTLSVGICVPRGPRICQKIVRMKIANLFFSSIMAVLHFIQPFLFSFAPCNIIASQNTEIWLGQAVWCWYDVNTNLMQSAKVLWVGWRLPVCKSNPISFCGNCVSSIKICNPIAGC